MRITRADVAISIASAAIAVSALAGGGVAQASQAHPSPDSSCSILHSKATYFTPKTHKRDFLQCRRHTTASGTRRQWKIIGH